MEAMWQKWSKCEKKKNRKMKKKNRKMKIRKWKREMAIEKYRKKWWHQCLKSMACVMKKMKIMAMKMAACNENAWMKRK